MIVIIDNYDSFTYNLFQYVGEFYDDLIVLKNDDPQVNHVNNIKAFIFSPGPGKPSDTGLMPQLIKDYCMDIPMFGICLGHQAIIEVFGGEIINASEIWHGKVHKMKHFSNSIIFSLINNNFQATRYHSLVASKSNLPNCLEITAISDTDNEIMGIQHKEHKIFGVQFHPESIETKDGLQMIKNFIEII